MTILSTYNKATEHIEILANYIYLIDNYKIESVESLIIYLYAKHSSISKVVKFSKTQTYSFELNSNLITPNYVRQVILSKPNDELHALVQKIFKKKVKPRKAY